MTTKLDFSRGPDAFVTSDGDAAHHIITHGDSCVFAVGKNKIFITDQRGVQWVDQDKRILNTPVEVVKWGAYSEEAGTTYWFELRADALKHRQHSESFGALWRAVFRDGKLVECKEISDA